MLSGNFRRHILCALALVASLSLGARVKPGIEVLADRGFEGLQGKRVGLLTNPSGVDTQLRSTIDILAANVNLVALYAPEHGVRGDIWAGGKVESGKDEATGLPVHSLYGATRQATPEMLKDIDILVYDIQDVGTRSYTFISCLGLTMRSCAAAGIPVMVLDRPNPLGGLKVEGSVVRPGYFSYVSQYAIPYVYGLTVGELATLINEEGLNRGQKGDQEPLRCSLTVIPMEVEEFDGTVSYLEDVFNSTSDNNYFFQAEASAGYKELSRSQRYTLVYSDPVTLLRDTISPPDDMVYPDENYRGDLRLAAVYQQRALFSNSSNVSSVYQEFAKCHSDFITTYRLQPVYLRYAEALNRAGFPEAAFFVLKYGLCNDNMDKYMSPAERAAAGDLISFSGYTFTPDNTQGVHSRGSGMANADTTYVIPDLPAKADSILYVENAICDEMALETAGEGLRFYDLMRIAQRRGDPTFLARKVANRNGSANFNQELYTLLSDESKWYLPLK